MKKPLRKRRFSGLFYVFGAILLISAGIASEADAYLQKAESFESSSQPDSALKYFEIAVEKAKDDPEHLAACQVRLAEAYFDRRLHTEALASSQEAIDLLSDSLQVFNADLGKAWLVKGKTLKFQYQQQAGYEALMESKSIFGQLEEAPVESMAELYHFLGRHSFFIENNPFKAQEYYEKALSLVLSVEDFSQEELAMYYNFSGTACRVTGEFNKSFEYFHQALEIRKAIYGDSSFQVASTLHNLGNTSYAARKENEAIKFYQQALGIFRNIGESTLNFQESCVNNMAVCLDATGEYEAALEMYKELQKYLNRKQEQDPVQVAITQLNIGIAYRNLKNWRQADAYMRKALSLAKSTGQRPRVAKVQQEMALLEKEKGNMALARTLIQQSIASLMLEKTGSDDFDDSPNIACLDEILLQESYGFLAKLLSESPELAGSRTAANEEIIRIMRIYDQLSRQIQLRISNQADKLFQNSHNQDYYRFGLQAARENWRETGDPAYAFAGFQFMEKSKSRLLLESVSKSRARFVADLPQKYREREAGLARQISDLENNISQNSTPELLKSLHTLRLQKDQLSDSIMQEFPSYRRLVNRRKMPNLATIREKILKPEAALIEYFVADTSVYAFFLSRDTLALLSLSEGKAILDSAAAISAFLGTPMSSADRFPALSHFLYQKLLAPLPHLPKRLQIIPDGLISQVPFEVLLKSELAEPTYKYRKMPLVIFDHVVSYLNSVELLEEQIALAKREHNGMCLGFAWSGRGEGQDNHVTALRNETWGNLPGTGKELEGIARLVGGDFYFGTEARESVLKNEAPDYGILHLALHGKAAENEPFLVFPVGENETEDGILHLNEMYGLRLNAQLAVLSSCESGRGKIQQGEGVLSMAHGFAFAGIPAVVTNLWEVDDRSAVQLMNAFYEHLQAGLPIDEALAQAKIQYLTHARSSSSGPFFWASFIAIGNTQTISGIHPPALPDPGRKPWVIVAAGVLLFGLIGLFIRRNNARKSPSGS